MNNEINKTTFITNTRVTLDNFVKQETSHSHSQIHGLWLYPVKSHKIQLRVHILTQFCKPWDIQVGLLWTSNSCLVWSVWWVRPSPLSQLPLERTCIRQFLSCSRCRHVGTMWVQTHHPSLSLLSWDWCHSSFPPFCVGVSLGWGLQPMDLFT